MKDAINTPFGDIHVKVNNENISFMYREKKVMDEYEKSNKKIKIYLIDIDTIKLKVNDTIFCGFDKMNFDSYRETDENTDMLSVLNNHYLLKLYGYNPETYDGEVDYSYDIEKRYLSKSNLGMTYYIKRNPINYINKFYRSKVVTLVLCWVEKYDFENADFVIDMILTDNLLNWPHVI